MAQVITFEDFQPVPRYDSVPWTHATVEEGPTASGPWTLIDTITLDPIDVDPAVPQTRNLTIENASDAAGLWYRLIFLDDSENSGLPSTPLQNVIPEPTFASVSDFATRIGLTLTDAEATRAESLLAQASGLIQDEANQTIVRVDDDEITMHGTTDERIPLPQRPVIAVTSVLLDGLPLTGWHVEGDAIVRRQPIQWWREASTALLLGGEPFLLGSSFGRPDQTLTITYSHGYDDENIPRRCKQVCLEAVVRVWVNPGSVARETEGNTQTVYDNMRFAPTGLLLTDDERKLIRRLFGTRARSVAVN